MNNVLKFGLFLMLSVVLFSCKKKDAVEARDATSDAAAATEAATVYAVNTTSSVINWVGKKSFIPDQHNGTIKLSSGKLALENGKLVAGEFEIDMNSIVDEDLKKEDMNAKLVGHLKSDDFFAVQTYPTAKFEITNVEVLEGNPSATHNITGNLTMRGTTKEITFPANVAIADGKLTGVSSEFTIDRTNWNVMYNTEKAGIVNLAKDKIISDAITLRIMLNAEKTMM